MNRKEFSQSKGRGKLEINYIYCSKCHRKVKYLADDNRTLEKTECSNCGEPVTIGDISVHLYDHDINFVIRPIGED